MAIDEAIFLETIKGKKKPTIRFYGWHPEAVSIGYFQDPQNELNIEQCSNMGVDIVRRLTGGKAVFHNDEITYSVVAGVGEKSFPADILGTYKVISDCLLQGLAYLGIKANLATAGRATKNKDLIVVETDDALLICRKGSSHRVREVVDILRREGLEDYL